MTPEEAQQILAASLLVSGVSLVVAVGVYVWYAVMLAKVLAQYGQPAWSAWVPVYNEMQVFRIGGQQPWLALLLFVPIAQVVGLVFKVFALHRISKQSWRGVGTTVLGVLLPPVWATVLAVGPSPDPERGRMSRGAATGPVPPVQPNGPLAAPFPAAPQMVQAAPIQPAPAQPAPAVPVPISPDLASSPFAPPSAFGVDEPARVPGRIEPMPPMSGPVPAGLPARTVEPAPAPATPTFATITNPFIATSSDGAPASASVPSPPAAPTTPFASPFATPAAPAVTPAAPYAAAAGAGARQG